MLLSTFIYFIRAEAYLTLLNVDKNCEDFMSIHFFNFPTTELVKYLHILCEALKLIDYILDVLFMFFQH